MTRAIAAVSGGGILRGLKVIDDSMFTRLRCRLDPDILNVGGKKTGVVRASSVLVPNGP